MPRQPRKRPDVLYRKQREDGSVEETLMTWQQAHGKWPEHVQWLFESTYLQNEIFQGETDRGLAVLAPAYLDTLLEELLRAFLRPTDAIDTLLQPSGPLGAYSVRIDLAHALGFLSDKAGRDLHLLRKIRNEFAHSVDTHAFSEDRVRNWCRELSPVEAYKHARVFDFSLPSTPRQVFEMAISSSIAEIANGMRYVRRRAVVPPIQKPDENWVGHESGDS